VWAGAGVANAAVTDATVSGGSLSLGVELDSDPAGVSLLTGSVEPTVIDFTLDGEETSLGLTLFQFNTSSEAWIGLDFALDAGRFTSDPSAAAGGGVGSRKIGDDTRATLLAPIGIGSTFLTNLDLSLGPGSGATLTVTPILVPEPALGWGGVTTLLLSRGRRRG
jgi:hypothetical protein